RPPSGKDNRENNAARSWLMHVFTQPRARLCENLGSQIARRRSFSISVSLKNERTDGRHRGKTIEKTMLRVLGSSTVSLSLGQNRKRLASHRSFRSARISGLCLSDRRATSRGPTRRPGPKMRGDFNKPP